jgi:hypothetical protein
MYSYILQENNKEIMKLILKDITIDKRCQRCALAGGILGNKGIRHILCDIDNQIRSKNDACNHFIAAFKEFKRLI